MKFDVRQEDSRIIGYQLWEPEIITQSLWTLCPVYKIGENPTHPTVRVSIESRWLTTTPSTVCHLVSVRIRPGLVHWSGCKDST